MKKTIFVTLPFGLAIRNILFTGVLDKVLAQEDVRVVAFTPISDLADRHASDNDRLIFEPLPARKRYGLTGLINHVLNLRFKTMIDDPAFTSIKLKRRWLREVRLKQWLFEWVLSQPFPRSKILYRILSAIQNKRLGVSPEIPEYFEKYQPSLMFATNPTVMLEHDFLKYAKRSNVPTVGMIHSWDDLTTEGRMVVPIDHYFVWNQVMVRELVNLHGAQEDQVDITGIPQFDAYAESVPTDGKDAFLSEQGLDPKKPTVLFATSAGGDSPEEPEILERLVIALNEKTSGNVQFLVRIHRRDIVSRYETLTQKNVRFQEPGDQIANLDDKRLVAQSDLHQLRNTLAYTDVTINTASTISIDAAALDRPVVNINFDLRARDYIHSVRRYFDMVHQRPFVASQATKLAGSFDELVAFTMRYLKNPELERKERASLTETMCYKVDGKSAERISSFLLDALSAATGAEQAVAANV